MQNTKGIFKRIVATALSVVMSASVLTVCAVAEDRSDIYGDINSDRVVNSVDALIALRHSTGKESINKMRQQYAEVNGDLEINSTDALLILKFASGKIDSLPTYGDPIRETIIDIPDSVLQNGAYEYDVTADNSFEVSVEGLAEKTIYCCTSKVYTSVNNAIIRKDYARFFYSLQGLVNRDFGNTHTSLIYIDQDKYLDEMMAEGNFFYGYNTVTIDNFDDFFVTFAKQIESCGLVLWDVNVPATANAAATICGVDGYLPVKYDTGQKSLYNKIMSYSTQKGGEYDIEVKQNLVGMFTGSGTLPGSTTRSSKSTKCDVYLWMLENYMDRCSSKYVAYAIDGSVCIDGNPFITPAAGDMGNCSLLNHDYFVARRCFVFDLSPNCDEAPCDDPKQPMGCDSDTLLAILRALYNRNNGNFFQIIGFVPWWAKYTTFCDRGSQDPVALEWYSIEVFSAYNGAVEADCAAPSSASNASVCYKYVSTYDDYNNNTPTDTEKYDPNTHYYLYYAGDYDAGAWMKEMVLINWNDTNLGSIPLMWCFNPNISDRFPNVFEYAYKHRTQNDYFASTEGAGYVNPSALYKGFVNHYNKYIRGNETSIGKWATYNKKYYSRLGMDITGFIINGQSNITDDILDNYSRFSTVGSFGNSGNVYSIVNRNSMNYVGLHIQIDTKDENRATSAQEMYNFMTNSAFMGKYNFCAYRTIKSTPTELKNLTDTFTQYATDKGTKVKLVDPYTFFRLVKESGQAKPSISK